MPAGLVLRVEAPNAAVLLSMLSLNLELAAERVTTATGARQAENRPDLEVVHDHAPRALADVRIHRWLPDPEPWRGQALRILGLVLAL
jgi:hypothetical protein